jgi:polysialic acid transporter
VPTKPEGNGKALTQWLSVGTTVAGLATLIAAIANLIK